MRKLRFKQFLRDRNQFSKTGEETLLSVSEYYGVKPRAEAFGAEEHETRAATLEGYRIVKPNDLVMNYMLAWKGAYGVSDHEGIVSPAYSVFKIDQNVMDVRYLHHRVRSDDMKAYFRSRSKGIIESRLRLYPDNLLASDIEIPDLNTQRQIADFLDRETARIDLLIEKKQRLVALLRERENILVESKLNEVDTRHFCRLKFAINRIEQGWSPQCEDTLVQGEQWGVLKLGAITTGVYLEDQHKALPRTIAPIPALRVREGDVLVARASGSPKLVGKAAFVETTTLNLMLSDKHFRLVSNSMKVAPEYLAIVVNSEQSRIQIEERLSSAEGMARNIGQSVLYGLRCPFPPLETQNEILRAVRSLRSKTNAILVQTNASIDRLKEYRSAIITAAVTGQIDVTSWGRRGEADRRLERLEAGAAE